MDTSKQERDGQGSPKISRREDDPPSMLTARHDESTAKLGARTIHILGMGSIGILVAHSLMCLQRPPPVCLLLHRPDLVDKFNGSIGLVNKETSLTDKRSGYRAAVLQADGQSCVPHWRQVRSQAAPDPADLGETLDSGMGFIHFLILSCKAPATVSAIQSVKHRISTRTTICLMQNGMGQIEELNEKVFDKSGERPAYLLGIISHGLHLVDTFTAVHAGRGSIALGIVPDLKQPLQKAGSLSAAPSEYLLDTLLQADNLGCARFEYYELLQLQLEKLLVNSVLNPLTALLDVRNGQMLNNAALSHVQRGLIAEISAVIQELPELKGNPNVRTRFSPENLTHRFVSVTRTTAANSSSMREDIRNKKSTEIDYINGYIVVRGEQLGIKCVMNELMVQLIKGKTRANEDEVRDGSRLV